MVVCVPVVVLVEILLTMLATDTTSPSSWFVVSNAPVIMVAQKHRSATWVSSDVALSCLLALLLYYARLHFWSLVESQDPAVLSTACHVGDKKFRRRAQEGFHQDAQGLFNELQRLVHKDLTVSCLWVARAQSAVSEDQEQVDAQLKRHRPDASSICCTPRSRRVLAEVEEKKEELRAKATEQARVRTGGFVRRA